MSLSSPQPMSLSHTRKRPRTSSYSSPQVVASASEATESEAVRSLAARIPPELFEDILFYVNNRSIPGRHALSLRRRPGILSPNDTLTDLRQYSLVCLFWANKCRQHIFSGRVLQINSYEDAEIVRRYVAQGCSRLTQVHQLIDDIVVRQDYERSFLHLLYLPAIQNKLRHLWSVGPVPEGFNPAKLDTPHWGISPSVVVPSSFLRNNIQITYVHFPSFSHVIKYIRHFLCAAYIMFNTITWDAHRVPLILPHASSTIVCRRRPCSLHIRIMGGCTDAVHLALAAVMMIPNCPLHRLSDEERAWMIKFVTLLWGDKPDPDVRIGFDVSEHCSWQTTTMRMHPFHFVFEEASASTDRSTSARSVVGIHAYIDNHDGRDLPANFDALVDHARTHPTIRALVVLFDSSDRLQKSIKPFVEVLQIAMAPENVELVLAYMEMRGKAVGVDLVTLKTNGRIWLGVHWSDDILRQELKKRR